MNSTDKFLGALLVLTIVARAIYVACGGPVDLQHTLAYVLVNMGAVLLIAALFGMVRLMKSKRPADVL